MLIYVFQDLILRSTRKIPIYQKSFIHSLKFLPQNSDFIALGRRRAQLAWLIHTRRDISVDDNQLTQVIENKFSVNNVNKYNKVVKYLKSTRDRTLARRKLDLESLHLRVYTDASFATNYGNSSQLGNIFYYVISIIIQIFCTI